MQQNECSFDLNSGLALSTLKKYAKSELLERVEETEAPVYMHSSTCPGFCDYACNGNYGSFIAEDIADIEGFS